MAILRYYDICTLYISIKINKDINIDKPHLTTLTSNKIYQTMFRIKIGINNCDKFKQTETNFFVLNKFRNEFVRV